MNTQPFDENPEELAKVLGENLGGRSESEASEFAAIAAELGASVPPVAPPPLLKARLMDLIAQTPQEKPQEKPLAQDSTLTERAEFAGAPTQNTPIPTAPTQGESNLGASTQGGSIASLDDARERRNQDVPKWKQPVAWLAGAAAAALFFAGGVFMGTQVDRPVAGGDPQATATAAPPEMAMILTQSDAQSAWSEVTGGGTALLVVSATMGKSAIMLSDLPAPSTGETYQLWYIHNGNATSAGVISAGGTNNSQWFQLDGTYQQGMTVGVTVEPNGGSEQPTTTPVVGLGA